MDNSPIDYLKDTTDDGITLIDSSESFDMQDSLKEYILDRLSKNRGKDIVLKELESDYLKIAIKDKKDLTAKDKILLREWNDISHVIDQIGRENIPKINAKKIHDIEKGDLLILQDNENNDIEDLVVMVSRGLEQEYFMGIPVVFDENLASNVSSIIEPEDNKTNTQIKDWTFALLNEIESKFHISLVKENGWLDKVTSMDQHQFYNHYSQKRGRKIRNEYDSRAPQRARIFDLVDYYKNLKPRSTHKKIQLFNSVNNMKALVS